MSIIIKDLSYTHTDKEVLFSNLNLIINSGEKTALTGNNGCGKSTLMRILAGEASPGTGSVHCSGHLYYVPQHFGQYDGRTVAQVLGIDRKLTALHAILNGDTAEEHFARLDNDWNIEERTQAVLHAWHLNGISLLRPLEGLSGGEKTRLFLAGMELKEPDTLLLDEPTNNLDIESIEIITATIRNYQGTVLAVSHDRDFLKETGIEQEISFFLFFCICQHFYLGTICPQISSQFFIPFSHLLQIVRRIHDISQHTNYINN